MKTLALLLVLALAGTAWAGKDKAEPQLRLELDLVDGSHIVGVPRIKSVPVQTSYARLDVPLKEIRTIKINADHETAALNLKNGDKFKGVINLAAVTLDTAFGRVSIGIEHIRELHVILSGGALSEALKQALVMHYSFDRDQGGKVTDLSNRGNHGTVVGAKYIPDGKKGGAYSLSGNNEHITIPNSDSLEIRDNLTLVVWVNLTTLDPGGYGNEHGYIINKGDDLWWNPTFCLGYSKEGEPLFHVCNVSDPQNGGGKTAAGTAKLDTGKWYHLVGVYDGATVKLYVNGHLEKTEKYSGRLRSDRAPVHIGGGKLFGVDWGNNFTVHGIVDEVMIFDRALTEQEIKQMYDAQK